MALYLTKFQKVGVCIAVLCAVEEKKQKRKKIWMKRWLKKRLILSHRNLVNPLEFDDVHNLLRMDKECFYELLSMVRPFITKNDTNMRQAVSAEERLLTTLRYLATGRDFRGLTKSSLVSHQLLSQIIPETCRAIYKVLKKTFKLPSTEEEWKLAAQLFEINWQFNNCVGCIDGKHILIQKPPNSGSLYYNYKGSFSIVIFAVVNANYEFMYVHTGSVGSQPNGSIFKNTSFYEKLNNNELNLPESYLLPGTNVSVPYVFLGDNAFGLEKHIMKPFPQGIGSNEQKIYNYRLSRARRVVENAYGILASRFGVYSQALNLSLATIDAVVLASCALHNFLSRKSKTYLTSTCVDREDLDKGTFIKGAWRQTTKQLIPLETQFQRSSNDGNQVRNVLTQHFNGDGRVAFQDKMTDVISN